MTRLTTLLVGACAVTALSGCAKTTIVPSDTEAGKVATTTTVPTGTPSVLLPRLLAEAGKLSDAIGSGDGKGHQIALINDLYTATRPQIAAVDGVIVLTFDAVIKLCRDGEQFNRPADADKCLRNLQTLTTAFLAKHPA